MSEIDITVIKQNVFHKKNKIGHFNLYENVANLFNN